MYACVCVCKLASILPKARADVGLIKKKKKEITEMTLLKLQRNSIVLQIASVCNQRCLLWPGPSEAAS